MLGRFFAMSLVDDIDLATNINPDEVILSLKKNNISFYETGKNHGTITAIIDDKKFEITSLRKDISTDGRHAKVLFSKDWREDAREGTLLLTQYTRIFMVRCLIPLMEEKI